MSKGLTVTKSVHFGRARKGRKVIKEGAAPALPTHGRLPRISRLMALAIHMEELIQKGEVENYAELACLAHVTRARITQIMNLLHLAPDIQGEILFLPRVSGARESVQEKSIRPIAVVPDWRKQRKLWAELRVATCSASPV